MTVSKKLLRELTERDGHRSAWTGEDRTDLVPHHIKNRGMGGSKTLDTIENLVWLESRINGLIESHPAWAAEARSRGLKQRRNDVRTMPVNHAVHGWCVLNADGTITKVERKKK